MYIHTYDIASMWISIRAHVCMRPLSQPAEPHIAGDVSLYYDCCVAGRFMLYRSRALVIGGLSRCRLNLVETIDYFSEPQDRHLANIYKRNCVRGTQRYK